MIRAFRNHRIRQCESLDGTWEFVTAEERTGRRPLPPSYPRHIHVPSAWETLPGLENYRGMGWLRTRVESQEGMAMRLVFGGVSHTGTVYVDGRKAGSHYDAFTPWDVVVAHPRYGSHELVVEVDNSFGDHSALHIENDYYTYGGITRPVELQHVPSVFIEHLWCTPVRAKKGWDLQVTARVRNCARTAQERSLDVTIDEAGVSAVLGGVIVPAGRTREVSRSIRVGEVTPWCPKTPALYTVHAVVMQDGYPVDDALERVGFREVKTRGRQILLNGEPLHLRGFNRHEDHPQFGNALPLEAMVTDLELMRDLGSNFVRTCHYPNNQRFLDLCDERGMLVWEEHHARNISFDHPAYHDQITASTTEMVEWHRCHPSIIMWGCLNECESNTPRGRKEHERILTLLKKLDPSRPVTFASNKQKNDLCLGLVDIVSWNRYDAWYGGNPDNVAPAIKDAIAWLDSPESKGGSGKPLIMSEFGAGAIYGNRQRCASMWSEEYQSKALDEYLRVYLNHTRISGSVIWQFCDVRVTPRWWGGRPRTMNNKGVVDEHRRPKMAYPTVKNRMSAFD